MRFVSFPGRYAIGFSLLALALPMGGPVSAGEDVTAGAAFETLKSLDGRWEDTSTSEDGALGLVEIRVSAAGHTILQTDFPGTSREMITAYHLDGADLVRKHYCVMGNQPEMRLDVESSTPNVLRFVFAGGTNLDPAKDIHVHNGEIRILEDDRIEAVWAVHGNGKKTGTNEFFLKRKRGVRALDSLQKRRPLGAATTTASARESRLFTSRRPSRFRERRPNRMP